LQSPALSSLAKLTAKHYPVAMANDELINLVGWCRRERDSLRMQQEMLQSGRFRIFNVEGTEHIDTTPDSIERIKVNIAELDLILADYQARGVHG